MRDRKESIQAMKPPRTPDLGIANRDRLRLAAALLIVVTGNIVAEPSFPAIDAEPLGTVAKDALVLHEGWQMRESVLAGDDGSAISRAGFKTAGWYDTSVPATALSVLVRHGIYPDPYIGTNNMFIPDASDDHNRRYQLGRFSHLPDKSNPWAKPYWYRREFVLPESYAGENVYTVSVCNTSAVPAVHIWLEVIRGVQGDQVLPAFWSDNALNLMPGERRELTARFRSRLLGDSPPHLMVEGWNVSPDEHSVIDGQTVPLSMHVIGCAQS